MGRSNYKSRARSSNPRSGPPPCALQQQVPLATPGARSTRPSMCCKVRIDALIHVSHIFTLNGQQTSAASSQLSDRTNPKPSKQVKQSRADDKSGHEKKRRLSFEKPCRARKSRSLRSKPRDSALTGQDWKPSLHKPHKPRHLAFRRNSPETKAPSVTSSGYKHHSDNRSEMERATCG